MAKQLNVAGMRREYNSAGDIFDTSNLVAKEPFANFSAWFDLACQTPGVLEPNAMSLATATKDGRPSVRIVLLKGFGKDGFVFFTNYGSRKGQDLMENPYASLGFYWCLQGEETKSWSRQAENPIGCILFHWDLLHRMVRVDGVVEKLPREKSEEYFHSRPKASQIGACVSRQSTVIPCRQVLDDTRCKLEEKYSDVEKLPLPDYWGGYVLKPEVMEFWQGQTDRLHDRIIFRRPRENEVIDPELTHQGEDGWLYERLSP